jgi:hypothetical protein
LKENHVKLACLVTLLALAPALARATNNGYETIRISAPGTYRCINSKTDEITLSVLRASVQKTSGFFVSDRTAGIAVLSQLNADSDTPPAKTPSVNMVDISGDNNGQVLLPLEYSIANRLQLLQGNTETTELLVSMYLEKTRGAHGFGNVLKASGDLLGKLPIPANPFLTAANTFVNYANTTVQNETTGAGGAQQFASLDLKFADRSYPDEQTCRNGGGEGAETIAVLAANGSSGSNLLTLGNLDQRYCWRYTTDGASEIQFAPKPSAGCSSTIPESAWAEPSNNYTMLLLTAAVVLPASAPGLTLLQPHPGGLFSMEPLGGGPAGPPADLGVADQRLKDLTAARNFCDPLRVSRARCGVN